MTSTLTIERLLEIISPHCIPQHTISRIPRQLYTVRKIVLDKKLTQTLNILRMNHWAKLTEYLSNIPRSSTPISIITKITKMRNPDSLEPAERKLSVMYHYLIDLYAIMYYLRLLELNVENTIEYEEMVYE